MIAEQLYRHGRYLGLTFLVIALVGLGSLGSLGRQEDPTITNLVATVTTFQPGADPRRIEALITRPIEDELRQLSEVDEVRSTSSDGVSTITVRLYETLGDAELERAWSEVRDAVADAEVRLPAGASTPLFDNDRTAAYARILALSAPAHDDLPPALLSRTAQDLANRLRDFPGARLVELFGEADEQFHVELDPAALLGRGLQVADVAAAIASADPREPAGRLAGAGGDLLVEVAGELDGRDRIDSVIVRSATGGAEVRVADIGRVRKGRDSPPRGLAIAEARPAVLLGIVMEEGRQVDRWSRSLDEFLDGYRATAPDGILIETSYDQSGYTVDRLRGVLGNLALGVTLVLLVLLLTLGWRAALVVALVLPLCTLVSVVVMYFIALPIHQMSLSGLVVALGLLVDGSIVMVDEVRKRLLRGAAPESAITGAVRRLRGPLLASTVTTVLAFLPMALLPGGAGDFVGSIAKAVIIMLCSSLVLALALTPVLAARLLPAGLDAGDGWLNRGMASGAAGRLLGRSLDASLRFPGASIAFALVLPIAGFLAFPSLTAQFFPGTNRDQLYLEVSLAPGSSIEATGAVARAIDARLRREPLVRRVDWTLGESAPPFYYNVVRRHEGRPAYAQALVLTRDARATDALIRRLQPALDRDFPSARVVVRGIDQGPPVDAPVEVEISGPELATLRTLGDRFRQRLEDLQGVTHTNASLIDGPPKVLFRPDEARARRLGLDLSTIARELGAQSQGVLGGEVLEGTQRLPVRSRIDPAAIDSIDALGRIGIAIPGAAPPRQLALDALGELALVPGSGPITRLDGERVNTVHAFITRGLLPEEVAAQLRASLDADPVPLPSGYRYRFGGDADERARTIEHIKAPLGMVVAALLACIVLTFNSWRLSGIALAVCVLSVGLSLLSLALFRYPFGIQALIGVIGSIGVSINAAIVIMTALQLDPGAGRGEPGAVCAVVMDSSRHILSTTVTTFGGFLPLILDGGAFWPPFAMAIAGGVLLSTLVSFYFVPPLYLIAVRGGGPAPALVPAS